MHLGAVRSHVTVHAVEKKKSWEVELQAYHSRA